MKRFLIFSLCVIGVINLSAQNEEKSTEITLNNNEPTEVEYNACTLYVRANQQGKSEITLSFDVENTSESQYIFLFGHAYDAKDLKKNKPSIRFDKKSNVDKKNILKCDGVNKDGILQIDANSYKTITIEKSKVEEITCEIPLYVATTKNMRKYYIRQCVMITLNVTLIDPKPDPSLFEDIKRKYDDLRDEIEDVVVCPDKRHKPSVIDQKKPYLDRIEEVKNEIAEIKSENHWKERDEAYKPFKEIISELDGIYIKEQVCEKHRILPPRPVPSPHYCQYCEMTPEGLLRNITIIYQNLDKKIISKKEAASKADRYHKAYTSWCPNLKKKVSGSSWKNNIDKYYRSIMNY